MLVLKEKNCSPSFGMEKLKSASLDETGNISVGALNLSYRISSQFFAGISLMGPLGNCSSGYYTEGEQFGSFEAEDDEFEDMDENENEDGDSDCDDEIGLNWNF